jgi:hypothetical protein
MPCFILEGIVERRVSWGGLGFGEALREAGEGFIFGEMVMVGGGGMVGGDEEGRGGEGRGGKRRGDGEKREGEGLFTIGVCEWKEGVLILKSFTRSMRSKRVAYPNFAPKMYKTKMNCLREILNTQPKA